MLKPRSSIHINCENIEMDEYRRKFEEFALQICSFRWELELSFQRKFRREILKFL